MSQESSTASSVTFDDHPVIKETHLPDFQLRAPHLGPTMPVLSPEPNVPEVETEEEVVLGLERTEMESPRLADGEENKEEEEEIQVDQELVRITEFNRYIPYDGPELDPARPLSLRSLPLEDRMHWLVFHQEPTVFQSSDRMVVRNHYGAGTLGQLDPALKPTRSPKAYLVACDFSTESVYAMEWAMGSVLRDGDTLYLVTVIKKGDYGKKRDRLLTETSKRLTKEATDTLADMLLFDISLITYTICGKVKDVLSRLMSELTINMVVCGCRNQSKLKMMFTDSISNYLVESSTVPVTVIRHQKVKRLNSRSHPSTSRFIQSGLSTTEEQ